MMTYKDLYAEVAALGFESEIEDQTALLYSANRALKSIAALAPSYGTLTLIQRVIPPVSHIPEVKYEPGEEVIIPLRGATFSLKFSGAGTVTLKERMRVTPYFFDSPYTELRRMLPNHEGELILSGRTSFTLKDIACYAYMNGTGESDIPIVAPFRDYDMRAHTDDFFGFTSLPTDERGDKIEGAYFRDDMLFVPSGYEGEIHLIYRRLPRAISADTPSLRIDLAPSVSHLLPLLTAAYLWLDDDSAKAQFYMQMYLDGVRSIRLSRPSVGDAQVTDTLHWA